MTPPAAPPSKRKPSPTHCKGCGTRLATEPVRHRVWCSNRCRKRTPRMCSACGAVLHKPDPRALCGFCLVELHGAPEPELAPRYVVPRRPKESGP